MQVIIDWTSRFLAECKYTANHNSKPMVGTQKDGSKFIKKWKKVVGAFHHGAVNQPNGPLCEKEWTPSYEN